MTRTVTAVIPTVGRPSLNRAIQSVLRQTRPVGEIIVVANTDEPLPLPADDRIRVLRTAIPRWPVPMQANRHRGRAGIGGRVA